MNTRFSTQVKIIERGTLHPLYQYTLISICQPSLLGFKIQYLNHNHNESINAAIYSRANDFDFQLNSRAPEVPHVSSTSRRNTQQYVDTYYMEYI
jgi:hypothetical protein